mmetsp:Transcript_20935/g.57600  ORF Transcript_20935/g.57600 Transcript_20935/m.57600 type:complete len:257 (+) Transcript_20935:405-1175(+)
MPLTTTTHYSCEEPERAYSSNCVMRSSTSSSSSSPSPSRGSPAGGTAGPVPSGEETVGPLGEETGGALGDVTEPGFGDAESWSEVEAPPAAPTSSAPPEAVREMEPLLEVRDGARRSRKRRCASRFCIRRRSLRSASVSGSPGRLISMPRKPPPPAAKSANSHSPAAAPTKPGNMDPLARRARGAKVGTVPIQFPVASPALDLRAFQLSATDRGGVESRAGEPRGRGDVGTLENPSLVKTPLPERLPAKLPGPFGP